jgi:TonB family protein
VLGSALALVKSHSLTLPSMLRKLSLIGLVLIACSASTRVPSASHPELGTDSGTEQGPLSFETQWYDWGNYAQSMVSKIRGNWYANMPQIIRTGLKGVVTIRFAIHRDGRISDITILHTSKVPPYDDAARKAIELSSPLKALPADFPHPREQVTVMFYYNMEIPRDS